MPRKCLYLLSAGVAKSVYLYPVGMVGAFGNLLGNGFHILTLAGLQVVLVKGVDSYLRRHSILGDNDRTGACTHINMMLCAFYSLHACMLPLQIIYGLRPLVK
jgi:hypothetical protein